MFNEILLGKKPSVLDPALASVRSALAATEPTPAAEPKGIRGFFQQAQRPGGFFERLGTFGAQLQDINDGGNRVAQQAALGLKQQEQALAQQRLAAQRAVQERLAQAFGGGSAATGSAPQAGAPTAQGQVTPSLRSLAPLLLQAQAAGVDIGDYVNLLDKVQPNVQVANGVAYDPQATAPGSRIGVNLTNVNGTQVDTQDPRNANRFVPNVGEGQELVYDANGQPMVRALPGYNQARSQLEGGITGARQAAEAPYRFLTTTDEQGRPVQTAISNVAGNSIVGADPVALGSRERQAVAADERLAGLQTRVSAGRSQLNTFNTLRQLLPDVITGPGADARLAAARGLAAFGNEDAKRKVAATETFLNQSRFVTADLVRAFGANPTEGERKYAEQMAGGDINITPEAISRGFDLFESRIRRDEQALQEAEAQGRQRSGANAAPPSRPRLTPEQARRMLRERGVAGY